MRLVLSIAAGNYKRNPRRLLFSVCLKVSIWPAASGIGDPVSP
jgi:hypothetical protein